MSDAVVVFVLSFMSCVVPRTSDSLHRGRPRHSVEVNRQEFLEQWAKYCETLGLSPGCRFAAVTESAKANFTRMEECPKLKSPKTAGGHGKLQASISSSGVSQPSVYGDRGRYEEIFATDMMGDEPSLPHGRRSEQCDARGASPGQELKSHLGRNQPGHVLRGQRRVRRGGPFYRDRYQCSPASIGKGPHNEGFKASQSEL